MIKNTDIDFVIYWVNGNDTEWQKKKSKYAVQQDQDVGENRYRDWENLRYFFRGVEKYAPWVHKIFFISDEQIPDWLNLKNPNLEIVDHRDFIPNQYLPTFSSHPIELNLHRIQNLSEHFVVFNDDCFITDRVIPEDFFVDGKPVDLFMEYPIMCGGNTIAFSNILANDFNLIGKYYERKEYKNRLRNKILSLRYGRYFFYNMLLYIIPYPRFFGVLTPHFARPYLKSSFDELWALEEARLDEVCRHRFRDKGDLNIYIFRIWNLLKGNFKPGNVLGKGRAFMIKEMNPAIGRAIAKQKYKLICLNDECNAETFEQMKQIVIESFNKILPEKCEFEK